MKNNILIIIFSFSSLYACSQGAEHKIVSKTIKHKMENKMKVEIWSDIMCPFCYIGKRKFENALEQFPNRDKIEVIWHSYQLNPNLQYQPNKNLYQYVADLKGQTIDWSIKIHESLIKTAKSVGLDYRFDKAKVTNSFDAHRVIQYAKTKGLGNEIEERFFQAYFTDGALMSDHKTLTKLATEIGLNKKEVEEVLESSQYAEQVKEDSEEAQRLGANGVPFFVINRKIAMAGAQDSDIFLEALKKAFTEWQKDNPQTKLDIIQGESCTPDGECK